MDRTEMESLRIKKLALFTQLKEQHNGFVSVKQTLNELAQVIEREMELGSPDIDPLLTVNQISTYLTAWCRSQRMAIADNVPHLLPDKYKDPTKQNFLLEDRRTEYSGIEHGDPAALLQELGKIPKESFETLSNDAIITGYDDAIRRVKLIFEDEARRRRIQLNNMPDLRDPIRTPRPFPPRPTKYTAEVRRHGDVLYEWADTVDERCPPPPELEEEFARGERAATAIYENFLNEKYSLALGEWLERDLYRVHQSKHGAAVKDKDLTLLCTHCSNLQNKVYESGDFVQARWNWDSPTHWECPNCHAMTENDFVLRPLTREQCGDKGHERCPNCDYKFNWDVGISPMDGIAIDLVNNLPGYYNSLRYYNQFMQKCIATRKSMLGVDLSSKA